MSVDRRDLVIRALADWHISQTIELERQLTAWQAIGRAALAALDQQVAESRRLREESNPAVAVAKHAARTIV